MKLMRHGLIGQEKPGLIDADGIRRDLSDHVTDLTPNTLSPDLLTRLAAIDPATLPPVSDETRLGPPISAARRFFCIGLNYADHAAEAGMTLPDHPIVFMKACPITGPNDDIPIPTGSVKTDWEVELGVVIARKTRRATTENAMASVAGYCLINDVSERDYQLNLSGQWIKGKSCDGFGPVGPWLVTPDDLPDPGHLNMFLDVNGVRKQTGSTETMVFGVAEIIAHLSSVLTLYPGDIIATGTPPGVGMGQNPPEYLRDGDVVHSGIEGLGTQTQRFVAEALIASG